MTLILTSLPGPPLSEESAVLRLLKHNVTVGFGLAGGDLPSDILGWAAQNTRFDVSWVCSLLIDF